MTIKYYIVKNRNILLNVSYEGKRIQTTLVLLCNKKNWNQNKQRVKSSSTDSMHTNKMLDYIESIVKEIYYESKSKGVSLSSSEFKNEIQSKLNGKEDNKLDFVSFFELFIEKSINTKSKTTISDYKYTLESIKDYFKFKKRVISWDKLNNDFYDGYMDYQYNQKRNSPNTFGKRIKNLKAVMNYALLTGLEINEDFKKFKVIEIESDQIALNEEEVNRIYDLKLENKSLEDSRNLFIIGCRTGLRFSDFTRIKKQNIIDKGIKIKSIKTKDFVITTLHPQTKSILENYDYLLPNISSQQFNKNIKIICEKAEINDLITIDTYLGNQKIQLEKKKYELVVAHTSRRTFATILYLKKVPINFIMKVTGHKKESTFLKYIKLGNKDALEYLNDVFK